jgi:hypothetical protein
LVQSKPRNPLRRVRKLALSLPEAHEVEAWGEPTFRVKNKVFAMYAHANTHHGSGEMRVVQSEARKSGPDDQSLPDRFLLAALRGAEWLDGVWLTAMSTGRSWGLLRDGYR